jgi:hypothetical protein
MSESIKVSCVKGESPVSEEPRWNYWLWVRPSWRVVASYETKEEAIAAARRGSEPDEPYLLVEAGSAADEYMRQHCTDEYALKAAVELPNQMYGSRKYRKGDSGSSYPDRRRIGSYARFF